MTAQEVAKALHMTSEAVYKLVARGELSHIKISHRWIRVPRSALEKYLESHYVPAMAV